MNWPFCCATDKALNEWLNLSYNDELWTVAAMSGSHGSP